MKTLHGKTAFITGASRGIGEAAARELAGRGANVVLFARSGDDINRIATEITADGGRALAITGDVSNWSDVATAIEKAADTYGSLDILVNNAGTIEPIARLEESDPADWSKVVDINLKGVYYCLRAAIPIMQKQGSGTIINLSSGAATGALEGWSHYCATKAAVLSLTKCADKENRGAGIFVVGLSPGTVATDMQVAIKESGINPVSKLNFSDHIPPEWPARAICWLVEEGAQRYAGTDFSIKTEEARREAGLID